MKFQKLEKLKKKMKTKIFTLNYYFNINKEDTYKLLYNYLI